VLSQETNQISTSPGTAVGVSRPTGKVESHTAPSEIPQVLLRLLPAPFSVPCTVDQNEHAGTITVGCPSSRAASAGTGPTWCPPAPAVGQ
jgi:hypothetical protein